MPIHEYICSDASKGCEYCRAGFENLEKLGESPLANCPRCGAPVERRISAPSFGKIKSTLDDRAKSAGFHKLKKLGKGEYEKQY